jgi:hypothetical protein
MNFKIIKIYVFNEIILCKSDLIVAFELVDGGIQPDGLA